MKSRNQEMTEQWVTFHRDNPDVYSLFQGYAYQLIANGHKNGGAKAVMERIRWESMVSKGSKYDFKINNNYASFYARLFMAQNPDHNGFFRTRHQTSINAPATNPPPLDARNYQ